MAIAKILRLLRITRVEDEGKDSTGVKLNGQPLGDIEQRLCPRVKYIYTGAPALQIGATSYSVIDLSKTGVRFLIPNQDPGFDSIIEGTIRIFDEKCIHFRGAVIRKDWDAGSVAVQFTQTEYLKL